MEDHFHPLGLHDTRSGMTYRFVQGRLDSTKLSPHDSHSLTLLTLHPSPGRLAPAHARAPVLPSPDSYARAQGDAGSGLPMDLLASTPPGSR